MLLEILFGIGRGFVRVKVEWVWWKGGGGEPVWVLLLSCVDWRECGSCLCANLPILKLFMSACLSNPLLILWVPLPIACPDVRYKITYMQSHTWSHIMFKVKHVEINSRSPKVRLLTPRSNTAFYWRFSLFLQHRPIKHIIIRVVEPWKLGGGWAMKSYEERWEIFNNMFPNSDLKITLRIESL